MSYQAAEHAMAITTSAKGADLSPGACHLLHVLAFHYNEHDGEARPGMELLSRETHLSERRLYDLLHELESGGFIGRRGRQGHGRANRYWFPGKGLAGGGDGEKCAADSALDEAHPAADYTGKSAPGSALDEKKYATAANLIRTPQRTKGDQIRSGRHMNKVLRSTEQGTEKEEVFAAAAGGDALLLPAKKPELAYQTALGLADGIPSPELAAAQALCGRIGALTGQPDTDPADVVWIARKYGPLIDLEEAAVNLAALIGGGDRRPSTTAKMLRIGALLAVEVGKQRERHGLSAPEPARPVLAAVTSPSEMPPMTLRDDASMSDASAPPPLLPPVFVSALPPQQPERAPSMSKGADLWGQIASHLRAKLSASTWQTWFEDSAATGLTDDELTVALPGQLAPQHVAAKWGPVVDGLAALLAQSPVRVRWISAEAGAAAASWAS